MNLGELIQTLPVRVVHGDATLEVTAVVDDSRQVIPGSLYVARRGLTTHGRDFIDQALERGARAVLVDPTTTVDDRSVTILEADDPTEVLTDLAHRFHGEPSRQLTVIGITGTNGKTTTAHLVHDLLNRCGVRCGLIGTVEVDDGHLRRAASLTTPGIVETASLMGAMVKHHCGACVMEVSSHALDQGRVDGIEFDVAVFTNLSGDHLDYHGTMEHYAAAKARLFEQLAPDGTAIVNIDDAHCGRMILASPGRVWTVSMQRELADCRARVHSATSTGTVAGLVGPWGSWHVSLPLIGRHNVFNALQASAAVYAARSGLGDSLATALTRCAAPPGRLEPVGPPSLDFQVLVDYAHTDDALENVLAAVRPVVPDHGRLRVVFGCGGDRDRTKRPRMAAVACKLADEIIVTSDNPRTEDPDAIIDDVMGGIATDARDRTTRHADRRAAIETTIETARAGDVIVIAGKGHEDYQIVGTTRRSFDDRIVASTAIRSLLSPSHTA